MLLDMTQCMFRDAAPHEVRRIDGTPERGGTWRTSWEVMVRGAAHLMCGSGSQGSKEGQNYLAGPSIAHPVQCRGHSVWDSVQRENH